MENTITQEEFDKALRDELIKIARKYIDDIMMNKIRFVPTKYAVCFADEIECINS